ncbi:hypothetical protein BD414DRAFT_258259 [Trametes punicea]|nr:hypothetical protein BD414DRAFT_258259 [Trametes punicea]
MRGQPRRSRGRYAGCSSTAWSRFSAHPSESPPASPSSRPEPTSASANELRTRPHETQPDRLLTIISLFQAEPFSRLCTIPASLCSCPFRPFAVALRLSPMLRSLPCPSMLSLSRPLRIRLSVISSGSRTCGPPTLHLLAQHTPPPTPFVPRATAPAIFLLPRCHRLSGLSKAPAPSSSSRSPTPVRTFSFRRHLAICHRPRRSGDGANSRYTHPVHYNRTALIGLCRHGHRPTRRARLASLA